LATKEGRKFIRERELRAQNKEATVFREERTEEVKEKSVELKRTWKTC